MLHVRPFFIFSFQMDIFFFSNFRKSEFVRFEKQEIKFFWPTWNLLFSYLVLQSCIRNLD